MANNSNPGNGPIRNPYVESSARFRMIKGLQYVLTNHYFDKNCYFVLSDSNIDIHFIFLEYSTGNEHVRYSDFCLKYMVSFFFIFCMLFFYVPNLILLYWNYKEQYLILHLE